MNHLQISHHNHRFVSSVVAKVVAVSLEPRVQVIKDIIAIAEVQITQPEARLGSGDAEFGKGAEELTT